MPYGGSGIDWGPPVPPELSPPGGPPLPPPPEPGQFPGFGPSFPGVPAQSLAFSRRRRLGKRYYPSGVPSDFGAPAAPESGGGLAELLAALRGPSAGDGGLASQVPAPGGSEHPAMPSFLASMNAGHSPSDFLAALRHLSGGAPEPGVPDGAPSYQGPVGRGGGGFGFESASQPGEEPPPPGDILGPPPSIVRRRQPFGRGSLTGRNAPGGGGTVGGWGSSFRTPSGTPSGGSAGPYDPNAFAGGDVSAYLMQALAKYPQFANLFNPAGDPAQYEALSQLGYSNAAAQQRRASVAARARGIGGTPYGVAAQGAERDALGELSRALLGARATAAQGATERQAAFVRALQDYLYNLAAGQAAYQRQRALYREFPKTQGGDQGGRKPITVGVGPVSLGF